MGAVRNDFLLNFDFTHVKSPTPSPRFPLVKKSTPPKCTDETDETHGGAGSKKRTPCMLGCCLLTAALPAYSVKSYKVDPAAPRSLTIWGGGGPRGAVNTSQTAALSLKNSIALIVDFKSCAKCQRSD
ncbi:MAG: hypothetical protein B7Z37_10990 [Verrucomicrobia bacterium 12-59-8]|nr:MAG: hypothetical protein B7Z37_10990 [Verrucomicrobia bacterium 12-59-8]